MLKFVILYSHLLLFVSRLGVFLFCYRRFRYIITGYLMTRLIHSLVLATVSLKWVESLLIELFDIVLFACIGWVFHLPRRKKEGIYYLLANEYDDEDIGKPVQHADISTV